MSLNRGASSITPMFIRVAARSSRRLPLPLSRRHPAVAILIPYRLQHTDTSTPSGGHDFPPPGFNAEQARRPVSEKKDTEKSEKREEDAKAAKGTEEAKSAARSERVLPPHESPAQGAKLEATAHAKTPATEHHALTELASEKAPGDKKVLEKAEQKKKEEKKLTLWQKVKKEAHHYWDGTKLLGAEVRISSRLALKMAAGYELTRRETRQLHRTVQDLGRLVPFSVFVIVPFAELLLPVALRLFPNMLPSTYEGQKSKDSKATTLRATRKEVSSFLRETLKETGLPITAANAQREEFTEFFRKVRTTGEAPTASDVIKVCKIFKDDLTLDNLSRPQLVGICRYMNLNTFGTDIMLRYQIRHRMRQIKRDDKAIAFEGVESLSVPELQSACMSRGLRTYGVSPGRLRDDLQMWLDLRLKYGLPSTMLVLSNAFVYAQGKDTEFNSQIDALQAVLASVPEELFHEIELQVHTAEGAATNAQRLEVLREQQELIDEENEQNEEGGNKDSVKDVEDIDEKEERMEAKNNEQEADKQESKQEQNVDEKSTEVGKEESRK